MTIRKRILLYSGFALSAFLAAVFFASRFSLLNGFSHLERNSARQNIWHLEHHFEEEQEQLSTMARDYAQWDRTYSFMQTHDPEYAQKEVNKNSLNVIGMDLFVLLDDQGHPVLHEETGIWPIAETGLATISSAYHSVSRNRGSSNGILELNQRLFLVAYEPILTSRGNGKPRGTLVMGKALNEEFLSSVSRSMNLPLWLEPSDNAPPPGSRQTIWTDGTNSVSSESGSTMLAHIPLKDMFGQTKRLLVARIPSDLHSEGQQVMRYLLLFLMVAGLVHSAVLFFVLEEKLLARVELLNTKIKQITVSGDLSLRLDASGKDELSELAGTVNAMLTAIQRAKSELLQAQDSLRFHAEHDSLTGVLNRRAIRDVLRRELARCRRENQSLGLMLADLDHFKRINDRYGHGAGDCALVTVVQRISATLRPYDLIGRYGGEEFLVIAPGCDFDLTQKLAERIRSAVRDEPVDLGHASVKLTVSLGATLGTADSDPEFLVAVADSAMYQAKRNGRDRVEISLDLPEPEALEPTLSDR